MKKLSTMLEDLWVAVAFAEAGQYDILRGDMARPEYREGLRVRA